MPFVPTNADYADFYGDEEPDLWETSPGVAVIQPPADARYAPISDRTDYDGDEWKTPIEWIEAARNLMGAIDLDPATNPQSQDLIQAGTAYTKNDNGLDRPWCMPDGTAARVWCNPPYSTALIQAFANKALDEYRAGNVSEALVLVNNCTDTGWFSALRSSFRSCSAEGASASGTKIRTTKPPPAKGRRYSTSARMSIASMSVSRTSPMHQSEGRHSYATWRNIRSVASYVRGLWDWTFLNPCFAPTKIKVADVDGIVERGGHFLWLEAKPEKYNGQHEVTAGQRITHEALARNGAFTVITVWGDTETDLDKRVPAQHRHNRDDLRAWTAKADIRSHLVRERREMGRIHRQAPLHAHRCRLVSVGAGRAKALAHYRPALLLAGAGLEFYLISSLLVNAIRPEMEYASACSQKTCGLALPSMQQTQESDNT